MKLPEAASHLNQGRGNGGGNALNRGQPLQLVGEVLLSQLLNRRGDLRHRRLQVLEQLLQATLNLLIFHWQGREGVQQVGQGKALLFILAQQRAFLLQAEQHFTVHGVAWWLHQLPVAG